MSKSEAKIQDRNLEPHALKNNLNEIQSEINSISEQLDKVLSNGKIISEKTDNSQERDLATSTTSNLPSPQHLNCTLKVPVQMLAGWD